MRAYNETSGEKPVAMLFDGWDFTPLDQIKKPMATTELDPTADQGHEFHGQVQGDHDNAA